MSKISDKQIQDDAINSAKVEDESLTTADVKNETLLDEDISPTAGIQLSKLSTAGATEGDFVRLVDGTWAPADAPSGTAPDYSTTAEPIGTTSGAGVADTVARGDHVHAHGAQTDGTLHAVGTTETPGFISTTDKANLDNAHSHTSATNNPHSVTKDQVGLGNVDNTSDADKPISSATQTALNNKEDAFTKNTAFNKDFGTATGTVCQGDDSRLSDARTPLSHASTHTSGADDIQDATTSQKGLMTATQATKLDGIEAGADVTDSTNVDAAGAVMNSDTSTASMAFVIDEDNMVSNSDTKVPTQQSVKAYVDNMTVGGVIYQGVWNASTNTPALTSSVGTKGFYYKVSVDGTTTLDGISDWKVGDWAIFNGATWDKVDNTESVSSVAGKTGAITLDKSDVGLANVDNTSDADKPISSATQTALNGKEDSFTKNTAFNKNFGTGTITTVGTAAALGTSTDIPRFDHVHPHGAQTDGTLHALATTSTPGFLSAVDKQRLDEFVAVGAVSDQRFRIIQQTITTTSTSYVSYDTWTTNTIDAGTYLVRWCFTMRTQTYQTPGQYTVLLDGTTTILDYTMAAAYNETEAIAAAGVAQITFSTDATHTFEVQFRRIGTTTRRVHLLGSYMELTRVV